MSWRYGANIDLLSPGESSHLKSKPVTMLKEEPVGRPWCVVEGGLCSRGGCWESWERREWAGGARAYMVGR